MTTLHLYLMRQVLATLAVTVAVFTGVLLLGSLAKEMLILLIDEDVNLWMVVKAIGMLIPFILVFALPIGMLTATLLVFGRLSADQELTAMRASGVSLVALVAPVVWFSVLMSVVCAMINLDYAPRARHAYRQMLYDLTVANIGMLLPVGTFFSQSGYTIYIDDTSGEGELLDVSIYAMQEGRVAMAFTAKRARLERDDGADAARLTLFDGQQVSFVDNRTFYFGELPLSLPLALGDRAAGFGKASLANMSLPELLQENRQLARSGIDTTPVTLQIHSKIAFSFACIGFTLVGIPLGLQSHRRETRIGILLALGLISVYYGFFIFAESQTANPGVRPHLFVWVPNFLFQMVGAVLLFRADSKVQ